MTSLSDKIIWIRERIRMYISCDCIYKKDVKEAIKKIEFRLLKKYKIASIPTIEIIKEEFGKELCSEIEEKSEWKIKKVG